MVRDGTIVRWFVKWGDGNSQLRPDYQWSVAGAAELTAGQGTPTAEVKVSARGNNTVFIRITGLPPQCPNTASETLAIDLGPTASKLEEFTGPLARIPKTHIDQLLKALNENPGSHLYVFVSGKTGQTISSIKRKRNVVTRDLVLAFRGDAPVTIVENMRRRDDKLVIWLVPAGAPLPQP